jgi:queuosine precursor transporter
LLNLSSLVANKWLIKHFVLLGRVAICHGAGMTIRPLLHDPAAALRAPTRYLGLCGMAWISFWLLSILTAAKLFSFGGLEFSVAVLAYPVTYIFSDIFTEVYGYRQSRRIVWSGMAIVALLAVILAGMVAVPPSQGFTQQAAFAAIFASAPAMTAAAILAFFAGELSNSCVLAKLKLRTQGKHLWLRTTSSTAIGQFVDNFTFFSVAYILSDAYDGVSFWNVALATAAFCTAYEFLMTPVTYKIVAFLKRAEGLDVYDHGTHFNPLRLD